MQAQYFKKLDFLKMSRRRRITTASTVFKKVGILENEPPEADNHCKHSTKKHENELPEADNHPKHST